MDFLNFILMLGAIIAAAAVSLICAVGLVVWLAGGKQGQREDKERA